MQVRCLRGVDDLVPIARYGGLTLFEGWGPNHCQRSCSALIVNRMWQPKDNKDRHDTMDIGGTVGEAQPWPVRVGDGWQHWQFTVNFSSERQGLQTSRTQQHTGINTDYWF